MTAALQFRNLTLGYDRHPAVHHLTGTVECHALIDNHADINGTGAAFVERFKELQMGGKDSDAATDKLD